MNARISGAFSGRQAIRPPDRKSTRLNSSHSQISYAVFCLKKKKIIQNIYVPILSTHVSDSTVSQEPRTLSIPILTLSDAGQFFLSSARLRAYVAHLLQTR